ncbi:acyl-CoA dehydrogenase family protein [Nitrospirillum bahiense]|uniref:Alkylation response protein AidB-like acyl-CoA dehydrogenase n=1 Tax=Nitrospirillum amazonense TaxID=28077 RepID=A0A560FVM3_9PROT|nr:acyl-CoA dehydrogenase family protein [Nitrospirillum amazonense]TWB25687.1 alkylation response protein AidB-like acyl-CoA dehydrogenase [Nitrospirillum amazonense]
MHFALTDDQRAIRDSAQAFLQEAAGLDRLRATIEADAGWDAELWHNLAVDMGYAGLMVPEAYGGIGGGAVDMALVLEETGARLAMAPFFETAVLGVQTILGAGTEAQKRSLLPGLADGSTKATLALTGPQGRPAPDGVTAWLRAEEEAWRLSGESCFVPFAHVADLLLLAARAPLSAGPRGISLLALPRDATGLRVERQPGLDPTRPLCRLTFDNVAVAPDQILGTAEEAGPVLERILATAAGLLAAEQTGGAAFCLATTVDYTQQRVQFGRKIASFQAVKHELADMMVAVEAARSAALYAAAAIDTDTDLLEACSTAKSWCSDAYRHCAGETIQLHGGIGFTWEHHAHLYFKRAWSSSAWLGDPAHHRERVARLMGLDDIP